MDRMGNETILRDMFDRKFISYYASIYAPRLKRSLNDVWRKDNFLLMSDAINKMNPDIINSQSGYKKKILKALAVSAQKPSIGLNLVIFCPIVLTIRQPPLNVPKAIAACALRTTQRGTLNSLIKPPAKRRLVMIPIVFCASLPPWPKLYRAAERSCKTRDHLLTATGVCLRTIHDVIIFNKKPKTKPIAGAKTIKSNTLYQPLATITPRPLFAMAAPAYPPIRE